MALFFAPRNVARGGEEQNEVVLEDPDRRELNQSDQEAVGSTAAAQRTYDTNTSESL